jgi:hypothetical protein
MPLFIKKRENKLFCVKIEDPRFGSAFRIPYGSGSRRHILCGSGYVSGCKTLMKLVLDDGGYRYHLVFCY